MSQFQFHCAAMKPKHLMRAVEDLFNAYDPTIQTLDSYISDSLGDCDSPEADPSNKFIKQVLYSCHRYRPGLTSFLKHFFYDNASRVVRADYNMYMVMLCLALFRIDELGVKEFAKFANAQDPTKMTVFLKYLFDTSDGSPVQATVKEEWCKHYDVTYVEEALLGKIESLTPAMMQLVAELESKALGVAAAQEEKKAAAGITLLAKKPATVPRAPNITAPRPRRVPEPMRIDNAVKVGPEPTYMERTSLKDIEASKAKRLEDVREETRKKYDDSQAFKLHETRNTIDEVRRRVEEQRESELHFDASHRKPLPDFTKHNATVKLNTAAILREDALFKKKQAEEARLLKSYEDNLRDSTEYYRWKTDMEKHDHKMKMEQVHMKRMQAEASSQNARDALERQFNDNKAVADLIKQEGELMVKQKLYEEEVTVMVNKQLVREVKEVELKAPRKAEAEVFRARQETGKEIKAELHQAWERKVEEDELERERRMDKIRQLRTHTVHHPEVKVFDPTTSAGLGLLDEMSLVEMEERLEINHIRDKTIELEKRQAIMAERSKKQAQLSQRISNIQRIREAARESNQDSRSRKKEMEAKALADEELARNLAQVQLAEKLTRHREERKKQLGDLMEEEDRRKKNQMFQGAASSAVEETHFDQLLLGAEREAKIRQTSAQKAAAIYEQTKATAKRVVEKETKAEQLAKVKLYAAKDEEIKAARADLLEKEKAEVAAKKHTFQKTRMKEVEIKAKIVDRNVYAQSINNMSLQLAKTAAAARESKRNVVSMLMT